MIEARMGKLRLTLDAPESIDFASVRFTPKNSAEFEAVIADLGGLGAFDPLDSGGFGPRLSHFSEDRKVYVVVEIPADVAGGERQPVYPGLAKLAERQREQAAAREAAIGEPMPVADRKSA
jgi:hypothetical protein